jgi:3-oxoacyl-[acyl-carrier-protein] synthase-3
MYTVGHSRLISTGVYIPEQRVTSRELMEQIDSKNRFGVSYDWLEKVTGIQERRLSPTDMLPSDMAVAAAREALDRASMLPSEIDVLIYVGVVRDYIVEPATAHSVQAKLGAINAVVFDVNNACHGFMNGIHLIDALIATGQARRGLIVTGEQNKLYVQKAIDALKQQDNKNEFLRLVAGLTLGDAGAAMVVGPKLGPESGFMGFMLRSQGQHASLCSCGGPGGEGPLLTDMPNIIAESTKLHTAMFGEFLSERLRWRVDELKKYVVHQVGTKVFKLHTRIGGIRPEIMPNTVTVLGNITTATIPVNIHGFTEKNEVEQGDKIFISGAGSGVSISQTGLIWDAA